MHGHFNLPQGFVWVCMGSHTHYHPWGFLCKSSNMYIQHTPSKSTVCVNNLPVISRCIQLSMGRGRVRYWKGSKRTLVWPHSLHRTWDLSWPWNRSTMMERFRSKWFSHAWNTRNCRKLSHYFCFYLLMCFSCYPLLDLLCFAHCWISYYSSISSGSRSNLLTNNKQVINFHLYYAFLCVCGHYYSVF